MVDCVLVSSAVAGPITHRQLRQAFQIARLTADEGFPLVSMDAVQLSLTEGPPTDAIVPDVEFQFRSARIDTSLYANQKTLTPEQEVQTQLTALVQKWNQLGVAPADISNVLNAVLLPDRRQSEVFLYTGPPRSNTSNRNLLPTIPGIAILAVDWAQQARQLDHLHQLTVNRLPAAGATGHILAALISLRQKDAATLQQHLQDTTASLDAAVPRSAIMLAAEIADRAGRSGMATAEAGRLLDKAAILIRERDKLEQTNQSDSQALQLAAARALFRSGQNAQAVKRLHDYITTQVPSLHSSNNHDGHTNQLKAVAGNELYGRGLVTEARQLLGDYAPVIEQKFALTINLETPSETSLRDSSPPKTTPQIVPFDRDVQSTDSEQSVIIGQRHDLATGQPTTLFTLPDFGYAASPAVCTDGHRIAFHATVKGNPSRAASRIYIAELDGSSITDLGPGAMPAWSPQGHRLTVSRYTPARGIWVTRDNGTNSQILDELSWAGTWSPDGRMIAATRTVGGHTHLVIHNPVEDSFRLLTAQTLGRSGILSTGLTWSHDSRSLAFWTRSGPQQTLSLHLADVTSADLNVRQLFTASADKFEHGMLAWHPHQPVLACVYHSRPQSKADCIALFTLQNDGTVTRNNLENVSQQITGICWASDGNSLISLSRTLPTQP